MPLATTLSPCYRHVSTEEPHFSPLHHTFHISPFSYANISSSNELLHLIFAALPFTSLSPLTSPSLARVLNSPVLTPPHRSASLPESDRLSISPHHLSSPASPISFSHLRLSFHPHFPSPPYFPNILSRLQFTPSIASAYFSLQNAIFLGPPETPWFNGILDSSLRRILRCRAPALWE